MALVSSLLPVIHFGLGLLSFTPCPYLVSVCLSVFFSHGVLEMSQNSLVEGRIISGYFPNVVQSLVLLWI